MAVYLLMHVPADPAPSGASPLPQEIFAMFKTLFNEQKFHAACYIVTNCVRAGVSGCKWI